MMNRKNGERKKNEGRIVEVGQSVDRVKKKKKEKNECHGWCDIRSKKWP